MGLADSTIYRVENQISTRDDSSRAIDAIGASADRASGAMSALKTAAIGAASFGGFEIAKKSLIGYNAELEDSRTVLAGMLTMYTGAAIDKSWDRAGQSVERFQQMAAHSALETRDLVDMASLIERPLLQAGVSMQRIENFTFGAANAAKVFRIESEMAALDVEQALQGTLSSKDRFARSILAQAGVDMDYKKFNKLAAEDRVAALEKAFNSKAISDMAEKQAGTFSGVVSTLKDNISITLGKVGLPLFRAITDEVKGWNNWMTANEEKLDGMVKSVGEGLVTGFRYAKGAVEFIADHADTLITIGKVWGATRLISAVGGGLGSLSGMVTGGISSGTSSIAALRAWAKRDTAFGMAGDNNGPEGTFWSGGLNVTGGRGGAGGTALTLGAVGKNLPMLGQTLAAGYALGTVFNKLTGASDGLSNMFARVSDIGTELAGGSGATFDMGRRFDSVTRSMDVFDAAILRSAKTLGVLGGATGSQANANIRGTVDQWNRQINVLEDINAGRYVPGGVTGASLKYSGNIGKNMLNKMQKSLLASAGFDDDEIDKLYGQGADDAAVRSQMIAKLKSKAATSTGVATGASVTSDVEIMLAMKSMTKEQKESIDVQKGTNAVMMAMINAFANGKAAPGVDEVKKILLDNKDPFRSQMRLNQNITNNIKVEMSAKDPDRWMAELDAKVQRKIRAPSQARNALKNY